MMRVAGVGVSYDVSSLRQMVEAALGERPVDTLLRNCSVVNVHAEEVHPADIAILQGRIVAVRERFEGEASTQLDCAGAYVLPGFLLARLADHGLAESALCHGTTTTFRRTNTEPAGLGRSYAAEVDPIEVVPDGDSATGRRLLRAGRAVAIGSTKTSSVSSVFATADSTATPDLRYVSLDHPGSRIDLTLKAALADGIPLVRAVQLATLNTATHYRVSHDVGSVTPGRWADLVVMRDLGDSPPEAVYLGGVLVARDGNGVKSTP